MDCKQSFQLRTRSPPIFFLFCSSTEAKQPPFSVLCSVIFSVPLIKIRKGIYISVKRGNTEGMSTKLNRASFWAVPANHRPVGTPHVKTHSGSGFLCQWECPSVENHITVYVKKVLIWLTLSKHVSLSTVMSLPAVGFFFFFFFNVVLLHFLPV